MAKTPKTHEQPGWFAGKVIELPNGHTVEKPRSFTWLVVILILIAVYFSAELTGFKFSTLTKRGHQFFVILRSMFPPNWSFAKQVLPPLFDTIKMSVLGTILGAVLAIPVAIVASNNLTRSPLISGIVKFCLSLIRTMPTLVTALVLTYIFGLGTFAGTISIAIFTFSFVGKQLYELIETCDMLPYEAMASIGANKAKSFVAAIQPQVLPSYLSVSLYTFEGTVRHAAILGYVGAGGIGIILNENIAWREFANVGMILICLFVAVSLIETVSRLLRRHLS